MEEKTYNLKDEFGLDVEYPARAQWANENGYRIVEIEADESGRRFQIQEVPEPSEACKVCEQISQIRQSLRKYKEDVEQVELFGMTRNDYEEKKAACANYILQLRELEAQLQELSST